MPEKRTIERARRAKRQGKAPSTQAGGFVREEIEHVREGKHGARSTKQAIAIGLSKARRAGVRLPARGKKRATTKRRRTKTSARRSRGALRALKRAPHNTVSRRALSRHAKAVARRKKAA